jgi:SAM-dependent methyltransferase
VQSVQYEGDDLDVLQDMPNYYAWIMAAFAPFIKGHVVEYGAGLGTVSERLLPLADHLSLVEPSATLVPRLRARFAADGRVDVSGDMLEVHAGAVPDNSIDTVVMINVLEHIEDDQAALRSLIRMLRAGGHLLIFVPALQALMSRIDIMHGHFRRYHKADLLGKTRRAGADIVSIRYFDLIGAFSWLVVNKWAGSTTFNPRMIAINDRVVVPLSRAIEAAITPPLGKNLVIVARKPAAGDPPPL